MRIVYLVVLASFMLASVACATTYTEVLYPAPDGSTGINWIAMRGVPFNPDPVSVFGTVPIAGALTRWDAAAGGPITYDPDVPEAFGGMLLGEGYTINIDWNPLQPDGSSIITYDGVADGVPDGVGQMTDMWISLPGIGTEGGYHYVGHPFDHNVEWLTVLVTDGTQTIPVLDAVGLGWLEGYWTYWDAVGQGPLNIDPDVQPFMEPGEMYLVYTYKPNLALIIPAGP